MSRLRRNEAIAGYLFIMPWMVGFLVWWLGPMLASLYFSFTRYEILTPPQWIGLQNYARLLRDDLFWIALANTALYTVMSVSFYMVTSLFVALLLNASLPGVGIFRAIVYLPSQVPTVVNALLWLWIFNPQFGLANYVLYELDLPQQQWIFDPVLAKPSLVLMGAWGIGSGMLIFLAGLQSIPETIYEAASIDGAGALAKFIFITIPMLSPIIFFNLIMSIIASFQVFDAAYIMTSGGPQNATLFYVLYIFRTAFESFRMGYASAMAWVLFVLIMALTVANFRLSGRWVHYETERR